MSKEDTRNAKDLLVGKVLAAWIHTTTRREALYLVERLRAELEKRGLLMDLVREGRSSLFPAPEDPESTLTETWDLIRAFYDEALKSLSARQREVLSLRLIRGMSYAEICAELEKKRKASERSITREQLYARYDAALSNLRERLFKRLKHAMKTGEVKPGEQLILGPMVERLGRLLGSSGFQ